MQVTKILLFGLRIFKILLLKMKKDQGAEYVLFGYEMTLYYCIEVSPRKS